MNDSLQREDEGEGPALDDGDRDLDALCEKWVYWCREQRLYAPASPLRASIARHGGGTRPLAPRDNRAIPAATLLAIHIAYTCQPDSLDKQVFDLYYVARVKPIKTAAAALGIGRAHFYRVLGEFRRRLALAGRAFEQSGTSASAALHSTVAVVNTESVSQSGDNIDHHE